MPFRKVRPRRRIAMYLVNQPKPPTPSVGQTQISRAEPFQADGWVWPRPQDQHFDVGIRVPELLPSATTRQRVLQDVSLAKGGVIRKIGYQFNQPHGFAQVRTTILINGGTPIDYLFRTVDASAPATFQGSLPPFQIGSPAGGEMADVFIKLPDNSVIELEFVNASTTEEFSFFFRLTGWLFTE